jgi:triacylglycerol esterase/lipase EstA (alpha/beta hydrolase family)
MKKIIVTTIFLLAFFQLSGCANSEAKIAEYHSNNELVVLAHGLGRSDGAMWRFAQRLENSGFKVCLLDYATIGESIDDVLAETTKQIDDCLLHASKVHFVGHSLGGLVIRAYLQNNQHQLEKINIAEVVLIGTPNKGSELADHFSDSWLMEVGGGISRALVTGSSSLGNNLDETDVNVGIIAGTKSTSLTSDQFDGPNDGLVSVESTKLNNMTDFITIDVSHSMMRYNLDVAEQTIHFLQNGKFQH